MNTTRRQLLRSASILGGGLLLSRVLSACAVETAPTEATATGEEDLVTCQPPTISANHGHALVVSPADVAAGVAKTYSIRGSATHDHSVTVTGAGFAVLARGGSITLTSTTTAGHSHQVTVTCTAPATCGNGARATAISGNHGHSLTVAAADVASGAAKTYSIQGAASHAHQVSLTSAHFAKLKTGKTISVTSSVALAHSHMVTVGCA